VDQAKKKSAAAEAGADLRHRFSCISYAPAKLMLKSAQPGR
jgi:hypothetical protein